MPNWSSVLREIALNQVTDNQSPFDKIRRKYLRQLARHTDRNVIAYYSGFLSKPQIAGTEINDEDKNGFMLAIHNLDKSKGLDLLLHTPGGDGAATESLLDYLRSIFQLDIRAIVPQIAMSAGTMIACSCSEIIMGRESSAPTQTEGTGSRVSFARMSLAGLVQTKGFGSRLCSSR